MADRELVITHLQIIHTWASYAHERNLQFFTRKHLEDIAQWSDDAINLLKEQESKKGSWDYGTQCSVCKGTIIPPKDRDVRVNFCPWCGANMRDSYEQEGR